MIKLNYSCPRNNFLSHNFLTFFVGKLAFSQFPWYFAAEKLNYYSFCFFLLNEKMQLKLAEHCFIVLLNLYLYFLFLYQVKLFLSENLLWNLLSVVGNVLVKGFYLSQFTFNDKVVKVVKVFKVRRTLDDGWVVSMQAKHKKTSVRGQNRLLLRREKRKEIYNEKEGFILSIIDFG